MRKWTDVEALDLKPGDQIRYRFDWASGWSEATVVLLGDVTVKMEGGGAVCQTACFQRRQETLPPCANKKKWVDRKWDEIREGDEIDFTGRIVKHIGDRYLLIAGDTAGLTCRYWCDLSDDRENRFRRLEEILTDAEKLEKLAELTKLFLDQGMDGSSPNTFWETKGKLKALIEEYSK